MQLVIYILAFILTPTSDSAFCSCINPGAITQEQVDGYDFIVRGQVKKVEVKDMKRYIAFEVNRNFKGAKADSVITITTHRDGATCGLYAREGQEWLMYGYKTDENYSTGLCTRSASIRRNESSDRVLNDLDFLNEHFTIQKK